MGTCVSGRHAGRLVESALCGRCENQDESEPHRLWSCPCDDTLDLFPGFLRRARLGSEHGPALWQSLPSPRDLLAWRPPP